MKIMTIVYNHYSANLFQHSNNSNEIKGEVGGGLVALNDVEKP